ncbi:PAS domain-containing protein [Roseateles sp. GG27B]
MPQNRDQPPPSDMQRQDLRQRAEAAVADQVECERPGPAALSPEALAVVVHELRVHEIELEMQNDELRRSEITLEQTRQRYFDLYELAPVGYCTVSESGLILQANLSAAKLLEVNRAALLQRPLSHFIFADDQDVFYRLRRNLVAHSEPQTLELRMLAGLSLGVTGQGTCLSKWVQLTVTAGQEDEVKSDRRTNRRDVFRIVMCDISERKLAEQALAASRQALHQSALHTQAILDNVETPSSPSTRLVKWRPSTRRPVRCLVMPMQKCSGAMSSN